jgi:hypothetical protein
MGLKIGLEDGRPFRKIAGPELSPTALRLASLPLDPELAARLKRDHGRKRAFVDERDPTVSAAGVPVNVLGGYKFPGAPVVDLSPTGSPADWAVPSRWKPTGAGADMPPIPEFLLRRAAMLKSTFVATTIETIACECLRRAQGDDFLACELAQEFTRHDRRAAVQVVEAMQIIIDQRRRVTL